MIKTLFEAVGAGEVGVGFGVGFGVGLGVEDCSFVVDCKMDF